MTDPTRIWRVIVSALLIALLLATTMGMVWHNHDQCSAGNCTLCHLVIGSPAAGIGAIVWWAAYHRSESKSAGPPRRGQPEPLTVGRDLLA